MKKSIIFINFFILIFLNGQQRGLQIENGIRSEIIISIDSQTHSDYGLSYPITYEFIVPDNSSNLKAYRKFQKEQDWSLINEYTAEDFFNGIEAVRFDYYASTCFLSIAFSDLSDSIFIKITDNIENIIESAYSKTSQYYDNRDGVVTITADDWADWNNDNFIETCENFRDLNLWVSCGIVTEVGDTNTWSSIQNQLDLGNVEAVSHSRTHPFAPYDDLEGEVLGSIEDLKNHLDLPNLSRYGDNEYIYVWIAPYGDYDEEIDSMVSDAGYLVTRLTDWGDNWFSNWNQELYKYDPVGASIEVGSQSYWGSTDTTELNSTFDWVLLFGGIYHLMCHPNILEWDQDFTWNHIEHISNRKNVWYVGFGHLYLYRFLQSMVPELEIYDNQNNNINPEKFIVYPNYPNPFNPYTTLHYHLLNDGLVSIKIYDSSGRLIEKPILNYQNSGYKKFRWSGINNRGQKLSSGLYFYKIESDGYSSTQSMMLLK